MKDLKDKNKINYWLFGNGVNCNFATALNKNFWNYFNSLSEDRILKLVDEFDTGKIPGFTKGWVLVLIKLK